MNEVRLKRDGKRRPKSSGWKYLVIAICLVLAFILGYWVSSLQAYLNSLAAEYNTAGAIHEIAEYVEANGTWPSSWDELGAAPLEGVVVNWSIDIDTADRHDVMTAVVPVTGRYRTYPYADADLEVLWEAVQEARKSENQSESESQ